ncbi:MAG: hypothetical protein HQ518_12120 [Rhodopirellula sp.]|nr:hypothetical protein [Rhodopirellula sp.]
MTRLITATLMASLLMVTISGCDKQTKSTSTQETTIATPGGEVKVTVEKEAMKFDDNSSTVEL